MRSVWERAGMVALAIALTASAVGCASLSPSVDDDAEAAPAQTSSAEQLLEGGCKTVNSEWGFALEPWAALEADTQSQDFAQKQTEHQAVISSLQDIADRVEAPELRTALDASISAHQQYADTIWPGLNEVPEGYAVDLEDPTNLLVVLGEQRTAFEQQMSDADVQRYDLCGPMQSGQTAAQACEIANGDWVDGGEVFSDAANLAADGDVVAAQRQAADGLAQLKAALVQVTDPEAHTEMARMYEAYETYSEDVVATLLTEEQALELSPEKLDAYIAQADADFTVWDEALTAGEERLSAYCSR